jgi:hypothetical protein
MAFCSVHPAEILIRIRPDTRIVIKITFWICLKCQNKHSPLRPLNEHSEIGCIPSSSLLVILLSV